MPTLSIKLLYRVSSAGYIREGLNFVMSNSDPLLNWLMSETTVESESKSPDNQTLREILARTMADARLTKSERESLRECIWEQPKGPDVSRLSLLRRAAFDMVAAEMPDPRRADLLEWLHDIVSLLMPRSASGTRSGMREPQVYFSPQDRCSERICGLIRQARQSMDLCVFTITDDRLTTALLDAASAGVKIRLITDDLKSEDLGSDIKRIAEAGIPVKIDRSEFHMHHKFAIFDESSVLTGSYNWTRNADHENLENLVITHDPRIIRPFTEEFQRLWQNLGNL